MGDPSKGPASENEPDAADAAWLLRESSAPAPEAGPSRRPVVAPGEAEGFELADSPPPAARPPVWTPPGLDAEIDDEPAPRRPRPSSRAATPSAVDQVWSRGAEWGPTLAVLAMWTALVGFLLYITLGGGFYSLAMLILAVGMAVGVVLCYPIVITLERPVRIIPEQAAKDYYGALSHHRPHYRRMWLLLSNAGRTSSRYASFEGFQKYWVEKLKQLREGHAGASTPLTFVVADFKADKSVGKTAIDAKWTVQVFVRGRREQGPIWSLPVAASFTKGPDGMWYLDDGALAERRQG
jgi:hypothetical protein